MVEVEVEVVGRVVERACDGLQGARGVSYEA